MDVDEIVEFHKKHIATNIHSYQGWDHCYDAFRRSCDRQLLSLHVAACMGSYGMNRGKSLLRLSNYTIHIGAVDIVKKYQNTLGNSSLDNFDTDDAVDVTLDETIKLYDELTEYYVAQRETIIALNSVNNVTATLITKIMVCTLGCVPAYDRFFVAGLNAGMKKRFGRNSLKNVMAFCSKNRRKIMECQKQMQTPDSNTYPVMKVADIHFWLKGQK